MSEKKILTIIPARGGSVGVKRKNVKLVGGKPLIAHTIEAAVKSGVITKLVVATEDKEIAEISEKYGVEIIPISMDLANGYTEPVMIYVVEELEKQGFTFDFVGLIQCTSPFLSVDIIKEAVKKVTLDNYDSCITVYYPDGYEYKWRKQEDGSFVPDHDIERRVRRQYLDLPYNENGAFYITRTDLFKKTSNRFGGNMAKITAVEMTEADSLQIDSDYHLWIADQRFKKEND